MLTSTLPLPALVAAGYDPRPSRTRPRPDALPAQKALLEVGGRPLVAHVAEALRNSPRVASVTVIGLAQRECNLGDDVVYLPNQPSMLENLLAGLSEITRRAPAATHVLVTGSDAPLLSAEAVTWFVDACQERTADFYMAIVARATVDARFPNNQRTWLKTRAGGFCSGDLFLMRPAAVLAQQERLRELMARRKQPARLVQTVGMGWLLRYLLGRVHPDDLHTVAARLTGLQVRPVILPFAGAAMDVDKAEQLALVRAAYARRLQTNEHRPTAP